MLVLNGNIIDLSVPTQCHLNGTLYRFGRNRNGGRVLIYINENTTNKELKEYKFPDGIQRKDNYGKRYNKFMLIADFDMEVSEPCLSQFLDTYRVKSIAKTKLTLRTMSTRHVLIF